MDLGSFSTKTFSTDMVNQWYYAIIQLDQATLTTCVEHQHTCTLSKFPSTHVPGIDEELAASYNLGKANARVTVGGDNMRTKIYISFFMPPKKQLNIYSLNESMGV